MRLSNAAIAGLLGAALMLGGAGAPLHAADGEPPYESSLLRLAEILGALHYLRPLCGAEETVWRDQMEALLAAEEPAPERKARLVTEFNRGYSSFATLYRSCTPAAITAINRYVEEGGRLTGDMATRYGR